MSDWKIDEDQPAMTLAAIRWYAMSLEKGAMEVYITNPEQYPAVKAILDRALDSLAEVRTQQAAMSRDTGCPPGFENCNGACMPRCAPGA